MSHTMIALLLCALWCGPGTATVLRVDAQATGTPIDGSSWDTAFRTLHDALIAAASSDEIWMAGGTYTPAPLAKGPQTFFLVPGVSIYGGFTPGASSRADRDPANVKTILSGDLNRDDTEDLQNVEENSRHVVTLVTEGAQVTVLDGLVITAGNASMEGEAPDPEISGGGITVTGGTLNVNNCTIEKNLAMAAGGGMLCTSATVNITGCIFRSNGFCAVGGAIQIGSGSVVNLSRTLLAKNEASWGGAIRVAAEGARLVAVNCVFADNTAYGEGGAVYGIGAAVELRHCTLSGNWAQDKGGGALGHVVNAQTTVVSSILSGNVPDEIYKYEGGTLQITNSIVAGGWEGGNLDVDPRFRLVKDPPYQPNWDSPAINAAHDPAPAEDFLGTSRPQNGAPDIGAYEFGKDTDGGGLPDAYEAQYSLVSDDPSDDSVDSDGDGLDNREEYRRGSSPRDPADPVSDFYVAPSGDDYLNDGSAASPWQTIGHAMSTVPEGASTFPITVHLAPGAYEEPVVFRPYIHLVGSSVEDTTIQYFQDSDDKHVVLTAAEKSALSHCTVTFPYPITATAELLRIENVAMEVSDVIFNGMDSPHAIAVFVTAPGSSASTIRYCTLKRAEYGVFAVDSGVNVTRNTFEDLFEIGIFIRPPEGKVESEAATPMLGDTTSPSDTGFNRFRMSGGIFVKNTTSNTAKAEYNDWGVYTEAEIQNHVESSPGEVDCEPFLTKAMVLCSIAVEVEDQDTHAPIAEAHHPAVTLNFGIGTPSRDSAGGLFLFTSLEPGTYTCQAAADGYANATQMATVDAGEINSVTFAMRKAGGEGEGEGEGEGGCFRGEIGNTPPNTPFSNRSGDMLLLFAVAAFLLVTRSLLQFRWKIPILTGLASGEAIGPTATIPKTTHSVYSSTPKT
jgi:hypothetical protein